MNSPWLRRIAVVLAIVLHLPSRLFAQTSGASLRGRVVDESGSAVPGVTVTATNTQTGLQRVAVTESDGSYRFLALPVGSYRITAELAGFAVVTVENVTLNVATTRVGPTGFIRTPSGCGMPPGGTNQSVSESVTSNASAVPSRSR